MSTPPYVSHCLELLAPLGAVRARRMFGGWGLYLDEVFMALVAADQLYLKVSAQTQPAFERAGCAPFVFTSKGKSATMGYWTAPPDALDSAALMAPWARLALQAALAARAAAVKPATGQAAATRAKPAPRKTARLT